MSLWRQLTRGLRVLTNRRDADQDVTDEAQHYLEQSTGALMESGLSPDEARRRARMELGNLTVVREQVRDYGWENTVSAWLSDVRFGARQLRANPGFAAVAVMTLALGIGASTAIFSAVNPILFEPLPYPHAARILMISDIMRGAHSEVTFHTYRELAARTRSFEAIAVMKAWQPTMTSATEPEQFDGQKVSWAWFRVFGVTPALGRAFTESEDQFQGPRVAILGDSLWRRRFGGDRAIVGRQITLDDNLYTVVGVMPPGFESVISPSAEIWSPLQYNSRNITNQNTTEWGRHLKMVGRVRPGVSADQASGDVRAIALSPAPEFPRARWASLNSGMAVASLQGEIARGVKPALMAVIGAVILVLLIASVNVTNLLLARGAQRRGEFAMRAALGAGRPRLIRQLLTESLVLAMLGGALGMVVAEFGVRLLVAISPAGLPRVSAISVDGPVFAFAFAITTLIGVAAGLIPAWQASRGGLSAGIEQGSRRTAGGHQLTRRTLVVAEVALALMLLVSAGLLLRSLERLFAVSPGFEPTRLLTMQVEETGRRYSGDDARLRFFAQSLEAVRRVPGVAHAAYTSLLPLSGDPYGTYGTEFEDGEHYAVSGYVVTPSYFETMGLALRRGRLLDEHDAAGAALAVVISESLAKGKFHGQDPIGRRLHIGPTNYPYYTIVGVVSDVKQTSLAERDPDAVYLTPSQCWFTNTTLSLVARMRDDVTSLAPAVKAAVWSVDKDQPIERLITMDDLLVRSESERRFVMIVFEAFALAALVLAAIGIYGVLSGSVTERMREIGVRSALGASRRSILALVIRQGMTLTGLGVAIGLGGAALASRALVTLLFGVSRLDPVTHLGVIALLVGVAAGACWGPAWRAARVDPAITLRAE
ncbi:MAG TPA: ABC transporter permease [Bryobacteraceae bacterium]|nr:ABC transporter permease [Bryobacteraceae bacterium]